MVGYLSSSTILTNLLAALGLTFVGRATFPSGPICSRPVAAPGPRHCDRWRNRSRACATCGNRKGAEVVADKLRPTCAGDVRCRPGRGLFEGRAGPRPVPVARSGGLFQLLLSARFNSRPGKLDLLSTLAARLLTRALANAGDAGSEIPRSALLAVVIYDGGNAVILVTSS